MKTRKIIRIDEDKCTGCGQCVIACAESALEIIDGKAKLVRDVYCDGLGACLGHCPEGALEVIERPAEEFDQAAVDQKIAAERAALAPTLPCGCPSQAAMALKPFPVAGPGHGPAQAVATAKAASSLGHFPIKLQLLGPGAPFLKGADLVLLADCVAAAYPDLHARLLPGKAVAMGCPKLDDLQAHINRLAELLKYAGIKSLTVAHMEVPCCHGFVYAAQEALKKAGVKIPLNRLEISRTGEIMAEEILEEAA